MFCAKGGTGEAVATVITEDSTKLSIACIDIIGVIYKGYITKGD